MPTRATLAGGNRSFQQQATTNLSFSSEGNYLGVAILDLNLYRRLWSSPPALLRGPLISCFPCSCRRCSGYSRRGALSMGKQPGIEAVTPRMQLLLAELAGGGAGNREALLNNPATK